MKAANWQRFVFHQSPIYFRKYLPRYHYEQWMNLVQGIRLATRKELFEYEVDEIRIRFQKFVAYYEEVFYRYDINRVGACLPSIHQLRHVHEAITHCGPMYSYAQWAMERMNGAITAVTATDSLCHERGVNRGCHSL
ncbi:hypothetical protein BJ508DRAFT_209165 [Ascobolus immersus RN42]|uniref:Uncharacterized protein n=1 Tax=Ascobolus immersus RN42 TaxID=1160509 RepID=A0A3N4I614_ASCIM|nr:hypothetical protein BJ508DRAFT_209165 [Ascobolus immersus RN42]